MQQNYLRALLSTLSQALVFYYFAEQLLILSLVPLLVWLIKSLSLLRPQLARQPEWRKLLWLLSCCEYALILMIGTFVLFEVAAHFAHGSQNEFSFSPQTYPLLLLLNQTSSLSSGENGRLEIAQKLAVDQWLVT